MQFREEMYWIRGAQHLINPLRPLQLRRDPFPGTTSVLSAQRHPKTEFPAASTPSHSAPIFGPLP